MTASRWRRLGIALLVATAATVLGAAAPVLAQGEAIRSYDVDLRVQTDGSLLVVETIEYDFGGTPHHGIFRDIPDRLVYDAHTDREYPIDQVSVTASPATPDQFETEQTDTLFRIKVGDPTRTITGVHTYTISYGVRGALNHFADHDELYWNATGNQWPVPIDRATDRANPRGDPASGLLRGRVPVHPLLRPERVRRRHGDVRRHEPGCLPGDDGGRGVSDRGRGSRRADPEGALEPRPGIRAVAGDGRRRRAPAHRPPARRGAAGVDHRP